MALQSDYWYCTLSCFSLTVCDVLTLNPFDVEYVLIDIIVVGA